MLAIGTGILNDSDGVVVVDVASGDPVASFSGHKNHVIAIAFSPDGRTLTTASYERVKRWELASGNERPLPPAAVAPATPNLTLTADGQFLALAQNTRDRAFHVVSLTDAARRTVRAESPLGVTCVALCADGSTLAAGFVYAVRIWDIDKQRLRSLPAESSRPLTAIVFSPDVRTLATGSQDGTVRCWDLIANAECSTPTGHDGCINCLEFSPDGQTLASGGNDQHIRLWDVPSGSPRAVLRGHIGQINAVAFAPDGQTLASASSDKTVRLWEVGAAR
jgi:WD40 repeat protein